MHHLAPVQLPSVNEAQPVLWVTRPLCRRFAQTPCQQSSMVLCGRCAAVYCCCRVDWWGGGGRGSGMMWIVGELLRKRGVSPSEEANRVWQSCFLLRGCRDDRWPGSRNLGWDAHLRKWWRRSRDGREETSPRNHSWKSDEQRIVEMSSASFYSWYLSICLH